MNFKWIKYMRNIFLFYRKIRSENGYFLNFLNFEVIKENSKEFLWLY